MKIGFIGTGNMGGAIAAAVAKGDFEKELLLSDFDVTKAETLAAKLGGKVSNNAEVAKEADLFFLGVKPQVLAATINEIKDIVAKREKVVVVSMAAGRTLADLKEMFGCDVATVRIMPNTPVSVGEGCVMYACNASATKEGVDLFTCVMSKAGVLLPLEESKIDVGSAVAGSGPAFVDMFVEALADGGVLCGLPRDVAQKMAAQMVMGSAKLILESNTSPAVLKDQVCSPGGSTIVGVRTLEKNGFRSAVLEAVVDTYNKNFDIK